MESEALDPASLSHGTGSTGGGPAIEILFYLQVYDELDSANAMGSFFGTSRVEGRKLETKTDTRYR